MYRYAELSLKQWQAKPEPLPLILRGARQVGKTFLIENFAKKNFSNWTKINFETETEYRDLFAHASIREILETISIQKNIDIKVGKTLLFLDEIQECPKAIQSLRYFYEEVPGLHVAAAGSLLEFVLNSDQFKFPVGRVEFLYLYPMSFYEFLLAQDKEKLVRYIKEISILKPIDEVMHTTLLAELKKFFLIGGMPSAIKQLIKNSKDLDGGMREVFAVHDRILEAYRLDFGKYAKASRHNDLKAVLEYIPQVLGQKFKYSKVYPEAKSYAIKSAFELLIQAGIIHKIARTTASIPLAAGVSTQNLKAILLDVGLLMSLYDLDYEDLFGDKFWDKILGGITEQFVGQELIANKANNKVARLYFWERESHQSRAEVDYLLNIDGQAIPLEVKSGVSGKLKSLRLYMQENMSPVGLRVSARRLEQEANLLSIPLYAVAESKRLAKEFLSR